ncbi:hypothetical protein evm_000141 [Chilo suppressalis]|nr:hypothetical protein evm_000141 [Chilo suppressalis]
MTGVAGRTAVPAIFTSGLHRHLTSGGVESFVGTTYKKDVTFIRFLSRMDHCRSNLSLIAKFDHHNYFVWLVVFELQGSRALTQQPISSSIKL